MDNNKQYGFHFDASRCTGCKTCQTICKEKHQKHDQISVRRVYEYVGGSVEDLGDGTFANNSVFAYFSSISCNHCSEPVCVKACPTSACHKERSTGLVKIDASICIGCGSCARACPYDAPQLDQARKVMIKCDGCADKLAEGELPRCVFGCPQRALDFGEIEELRRKYPDAKIANVAPLPSSSITKPNLLITEAKSSRPSGSKEGFVSNFAEV